MNYPIYFRVGANPKESTFVTVHSDGVSYHSPSGTPLALSNLLGNETFATAARLRAARSSAEMLTILQAVVDLARVELFTVGSEGLDVEGFTVCLQEEGNTQTTHVSFQRAADRNEAVRLAMIECRADWGWEEHGSDEDDLLHVLAVLRGDVDVVEWGDQ